MSGLKTQIEEILKEHSNPIWHEDIEKQVIGLNVHQGVLEAIEPRFDSELKMIVDKLYKLIKE